MEPSGRVLLAAGAVGCTDDFTEINTNPNAPTDVGVQYLLPAGIVDAVNDLLGTGWDRGIASIWVQHYARLQYGSVDRYEISATFSDGLWAGLYTGALVDFDGVVEKASALNNANQAAWAGSCGRGCSTTWWTCGATSPTPKRSAVSARATSRPPTTTRARSTAPCWPSSRPRAVRSRPRVHSSPTYSAARSAIPTCSTKATWRTGGSSPTRFAFAWPCAFRTRRSLRRDLGRRVHEPGSGGEIAVAGRSAQRESDGSRLHRPTWRLPGQQDDGRQPDRVR